MHRVILILITVFLLASCSMKARLAKDMMDYQESLKSIDASFIKAYDSFILTVTNFSLDETKDFICDKYNEDETLASLASIKLIGEIPVCLTETSESKGKTFFLEVSRPESGKPGVWGSSLETTISYRLSAFDEPMVKTTVAYTIEPVGTKDFVVGHITNLLIRAYMPKKGDIGYKDWIKKYEKFCAESEFTCSD